METRGRKVIGPDYIRQIHKDFANILEVLKCRFFFLEFGVSIIIRHFYTLLLDIFIWKL